MSVFAILGKYKHLFFIISVLLILIAAIYLSLAIYIALQAERDTKSKADVILVPGARSYIGGKYNPCLKARVEHSVALYKNLYASKILMSGGIDREDGINEADTMEKMAIEQGVPAGDILKEKAASSTYENFSLAKSILKINRLSSVIIVTEPFHIARAALVAKKLGYNFSVSPAKDSPCWLPDKYFSKYFLKEPFAVMMYKLQGKL